MSAKSTREDDLNELERLAKELATERAARERAEKALTEIHKLAGRGEGHGSAQATAACIIDRVLSDRIALGEAERERDEHKVAREQAERNLQGMTEDRDGHYDLRMKAERERDEHKAAREKLVEQLVVQKRRAEAPLNCVHGVSIARKCDFCDAHKLAPSAEPEPLPDGWTIGRTKRQQEPLFGYRGWTFSLSELRDVLSRAGLAIVPAADVKK